MTNIKNELTKELMMTGRFLRHRQGRPRGQESILKVLANKGEISQKDLQEEMGIRAGSISEIISKLEFRGLVNRTRSDEDARAVKIALTEKGKEIASQLDDSADENLYSSLTEEEMQTLKGILVKLNNDWIRRDPIHEPDFKDHIGFEHHGHRPHMHGHMEEFGPRCNKHHCEGEPEGFGPRGHRPPMNEEGPEGFGHCGPRPPMCEEGPEGFGPRGPRPHMPEMARGGRHHGPRIDDDERCPFDPHFKGSDDNNHLL